MRTVATSLAFTALLASPALAAPLRFEAETTGKQYPKALTR